MTCSHIEATLLYDCIAACQHRRPLQPRRNGTSCDLGKLRDQSPGNCEVGTPRGFPLSGLARRWLAPGARHQALCPALRHLRHGQDEAGSAGRRVPRAASQGAAARRRGPTPDAGSFVHPELHGLTPHYGTQPLLAAQAVGGGPLRRGKAPSSHAVAATRFGAHHHLAAHRIEAEPEPPSPPEAGGIPSQG